MAARPRSTRRSTSAPSRSGLALSPTGKQLFVAEYAESRVVDHRHRRQTTVANSIAFDRPRALMVTNNLDTSDADETLIVAEYFGRPGGRRRSEGRRPHRLPARSSRSPTSTRPRASRSPPDSTAAFRRAASRRTRRSRRRRTSSARSTSRTAALYVTSVSASPEGPPRFDNNVFPVVYVADLAGAAEVRDASGTVNLARKIVRRDPEPIGDEPALPARRALRHRLRARLDASRTRSAAPVT